MKGSITDESTRLGMSVDGKESFTKFNNQILKSEGKQLTLLKHKVQTLTSTVASLKLDNSNLRKEKEALLALNSDYINSLNVLHSLTEKFYQERAQSIEKVIFPAELWESSQLQPKLKEYLRLNVNGFKTLEGDHRNLVQHCLTMQKEIKNYKMIVDECHQMKQDLLSVNHTDVKSLAREIEQLAADNRSLRTDNNRISFQCERAKKELDRAKSLLRDTEKHLEKSKTQLLEHKSTVNRLVQEGKQSNDSNEKRVIHSLKQIYELNVKCNTLEEKLRGCQEQFIKTEEIKRKAQMDAVEFTHKQTQFKKTLSEFSKPKPSRNNSMILDDRDRVLTSFFMDKQDTGRRGRPNRSVTAAVSRNN